VVLAKEQQAATGDIIFWYLADPSKTSNGKSYSSDAADIYISGYRKWLWNKVRLLLLNTNYFSDDELTIIEEKLLYSKTFPSNDPRWHGFLD
jgi:hypothetical protein